MPKKSNNPPETVTLELSPELAEFILLNSKTNLRYMLSVLMTIQSRENQEKTVGYIEKFKEITQMLEAKGVTCAED